MSDPTIVRHMGLIERQIQKCTERLSTSALSKTRERFASLMAQMQPHLDYIKECDAADRFSATDQRLLDAVAFPDQILEIINALSIRADAEGPANDPKVDLQRLDDDIHKITGSLSTLKDGYGNLSYHIQKKTGIPPTSRDTGASR